MRRPCASWSASACHCRAWGASCTAPAALRGAGVRPAGAGGGQGPMVGRTEQIVLHSKLVIVAEGACLPQGPGKSRQWIDFASP